MNALLIEDIQFVDNASCAFLHLMHINSSRYYNQYVETDFHIFGNVIVGLHRMKSSDTPDSGPIWACT